GKDWTPAADHPAAHPNARFTAPAAQCPSIAPNWEDPAGVPISALLFGGRRASTVPLVTQSTDWEHGVFLGASVSSETTAAATGAVGVVRRDPFAMLPFCGYNMADYFSHWLRLGEGADADKLPKIFYVNWFRKDENGRWLWPGFGDNMRVLKWVVERVQGKAEAVSTPIGWLPDKKSIDVSGTKVTEADLTELLEVDPELWKTEADRLEKHWEQFGDRVPEPLRDQLAQLRDRLGG
ncbi:MAG: phosphoenolpyruvate carboxykinase domain-containing protein, partial [Frankiaceae bacterium]